ncbi:hypothetical protein [Cupriavidus gilardii]|uniref:hypothetical protein n=1 Tax=Cupriavidus gilardii TaxID=82541 RepID=UPI0018D3FD57|nr:hypothetical protein [Cupriavidus gilardii]
MPGKATYIDGQLSPALSAGFGPQILLDNLPATLQPGSTLFYYNPEEENLLLQQAALKQTGKASFIDGLAPDSKQNLSAAQVEKAILYQNALEYAQANGVQLGEALTQAGQRARQADALVRGADGSRPQLHGDRHRDLPDHHRADAADLSAGRYASDVGGRKYQRA